MARVAKRPDLSEETLLWEAFPGGVLVFGVDEAGRGCLAGPVCASVACWAPCETLPVNVRDSKQMTEAQREECFEPVRSGACTYGVGFGSCTEIDRWNILKANHLAVARAVETALEKLPPTLENLPVVFLSDGNRPLVREAEFFLRLQDFAGRFPLLRALFRRGFEEKCIVKGDSKVFSIASASILAKVSRDRHMLDLHERYPGYEFASHKGYSTPRHIAILRKIGPCSEHRRSFSPVSESMSLFP